MREREWDYREKKEELVEAAKDAYDILVGALRDPINLEELADDKIRAAILAKKIAFTDAISFLKEIETLEVSMGKKIEGANIKEKKDWEANHAEKRFKK